MGWVLLEVAMAFGVAVFIVWWTFPKKKKPPKTKSETTQSKDGHVDN